MSAHLDQERTIASLRMAVATRGGAIPGTLFHTDRGSEGVGSDLARACRRLGLVSPWEGWAVAEQVRGCRFGGVATGEGSAA